MYTKDMSQEFPHNKSELDQRVESGAAMDPTDFERELIVWAETILTETDASGIAAFLLEHAQSLSEEARARLEEIAQD